MASVIRCDRCSTLLTDGDQPYRLTVEPLRIPRPATRLPPEIFADLCPACHQALERFMAGDEVERTDGPCKRCAKPAPNLVHSGWEVWTGDPCDGRCGLPPEGHTHHAFEFGGEAAA